MVSAVNKNRPPALVIYGINCDRDQLIIERFFMWIFAKLTPFGSAHAVQELLFGVVVYAQSHHVILA